MVNWLKRFFLSFFSDRQAKESVRYGFGNILLTSVLAIAFLFVGVFAAKTAPFAAYYDGAEDFREFLYNAFIDCGQNIVIDVNDGGADISADGESVLINTFTNGSDREKYSLNGYQLIVDSRNVASCYDDFEPYCVSSDKTEISYGDYLKLSEEERKPYRFAVRYTGEEKKITEADVAEYKAYFATLSDKETDDELKALDEKKDEMGAAEYNNSVYALYLKTYYPDIYSATGENVPTLRNYYYGLVVKAERKYFCLFGDMEIASFNSYNGGNFTFGGVYKQGNGLKIAGDFTQKQARQSVDKFIKSSFYDSVAMLFLYDMFNGIVLIVITELIIVAAMLLCFGIGKFKKIPICSTFANSVKIIASYAHVAAFITALVTLCLGFALSGAAVSIVAYVTFAVILFVRTIVLLVRESIANVKNEECEADGAAEEN